MRKVVLVVLCLTVVLMEDAKMIHAKVFTRCGLAQELLNKGFSRSLVGHWVCLIESESGKDTSIQRYKGMENESLGLFQIKSKAWCKLGSPGGKCNVKCEDLMNEDITDDSTCARIVEKELGFRAWEGWTRSCKGRTYPANIARTCLPK